MQYPQGPVTRITELLMMDLKKFITPSEYNAIYSAIYERLKDQPELMVSGVPTSEHDSLADEKMKQFNKRFGR